MEERSGSASGTVRVLAATIGLLSVFTIVGVLGLALGEAVPDRVVADRLQAARAEGSLTNTTQFVGRTASVTDHFTECISLSVGLGDADAGLATTLASGTHLGPCDRLVAAVDEYDRTGRLPPGRSYLRYWHGTSSVIRPVLALVGLSTMRVLEYLVLLAAAIALGRRVRAVAGTAAAVGLLAPLVVTTDFLDLSTVAPHALMLAVTLAGAALVLSATMARPTLERAWFSGLAAGAAFVYVDLLTNAPGAWILVAAMAILGARVAGSPPARTVRVGFVTGLAWLVGYAGMWFGKWVFAAAVLGRQRVVDDVRDTIQKRVDGESSLSEDRFGAAIGDNVDTWLGRPLAWAVLVIAIALVVLRLRRGHDRTTLLSIAIAAAPVVVPFVWYEVLSNHSQIHHWFTYRSLPIALGVVLLAVLTPQTRPAAGGPPVA